MHNHTSYVAMIRRRNDWGAEGEESRGNIALGSGHTRLVTNDASAQDELAYLYKNSRKLSICTVFSGLEEITDRVGDTLVELAAKKNSEEKSDRIRCLTSFTDKQQVDLVETFVGIGIQVRHIEDFPSLSFTLIENDDEPTLILGLWQSLLISTDPAYTKHFQEFFDQLWSRGMNAASRIEEIRSGTDLTEFQIIGNPEEAMKRIWDMMSEAHEVLVLLSSPDMLRLQMGAGTFRIMKELVERRTTISIRVLAPSDRELVALADDVAAKSPQMEYRRMDKSLTTCPTMLIIDRECCFVLETKHTASGDLYNSIGITSYTKSRSIANSYAAIFENLWKLSEMFERLEVHEKAQMEFIKTAAHELRNPVQAILTYSEIAMNGDYKINNQTSAGIFRNALRLQSLIEDLLDVAKIENNAFRINPEPFSLNDLIVNVVEDFKCDVILRGEELEILFESDNSEEEIVINADKGRIGQVVSNLLRNAMEFTKEGAIIVSLRKVPDRSSPSSSPIVEVTVRDSGTGIDTSIMPVLFSKFSQKSRIGTGIGLYISKSIIEAHGGQIWGANNESEKGATFGFRMRLNPISESSKSSH